MLGIRWVWFSMKSDSVETVPTDLVATALSILFRDLSEITVYAVTQLVTM